MLDLNDVAIFAKVAESGSFSAAAKALTMPKATVSRRVARLEEALGIRLLQRTTRKVELSAAGRQYYETAASALSKLDGARRTVATVQATPSGTLRATAPVAFGTTFLVKWIAEFLAEYPDVDLELMLTDERVDLIGLGVDVAFRMGSLADSTLIARKLAPTRRVLAASPVYLERAGVPRQIEDLARHSCLVYGSSVESPVWRLQGPRGAQDVKIKARFAVDNVAGMIEATLAGVGIGLLPFAITAPEFERKRLVQVLPRVSIDSGGFYVVYPSDRHVPAALRALIDFVAAKAEILPR